VRKRKNEEKILGRRRYVDTVASLAEFGFANPVRTKFFLTLYNQHMDDDGGKPENGLRLS
jgi:hypothetical protein